MRYLLIILLFSTYTAQGQTLFPNIKPYVSSTTNYMKQGYVEAKGFMFTETDTFPAKSPMLIRHPNGKLYITAGEGAPWEELQGAGGVAGTSSFNGRTGAVVPVYGDYSSFFAPLSHTHNASSINNFNSTARGLFTAAGSLTYNSSNGVFTVPSTVSSFTNDAAYITNAALSPYLPSATAATTYQGKLNGTGLVRMSGASLVYDNTSYLTGNQSISFAPTGDVTGTTTGSTALTPTLAIGAGKVTNAHLAGSIAASKLIGTDISIAESQVASLGADLTARKLANDSGYLKGLAAMATIGTLKKVADSIDKVKVSNVDTITLTKSVIGTILGHSEEFISDGTSHSTTGSTTEQTLYSTTIKANSLGVNGFLRAEYFITTTNNANAKTISVKIGGVVIANFQIGSTTGYQCVTRYTNRNSQILGVSPHPGNNYNGSGSGLIWTYATGSPNFNQINTAIDNTLVITAQNSVSTDTIGLEYVNITTHQ